MIDPRKPDFTNSPVDPRRPAFGYRPADARAEPLVTVMTPFYNCGELFRDTARCVLGQSFQRFEWVIVNDGSTDEVSRRVLDEFRTADPRIRVVDHEVNKGLSAARNTGYNAARTPWIFQIDGDDLIEPTVLEKCLWFLTSNPDHGFVKGQTVGFGAQHYLWTNGFHNPHGMLGENVVEPTVLVRKRAWEDAGGFDEANRRGLEDWDFWMRCADAGHWGDTIHEYLHWYRRRENHNASWSNWDAGENQARFMEGLKQKYPRLWQGGMAVPPPAPDQLPYQPIRREPPLENELAKDKPRALMVLPWMRLGGADRFNLDVLRQLTRRGYEVTVVTTRESHNPWLPVFAKHTPDIFVLDSFVNPIDHPAVLRYLIESRRPDAVWISNSEVAYHLLPYLRTVCPEPAYLDYVHMEEEYWNSGGHPRSAAGMQPLLDLNVVSSAHLKGWMADRGASPERIEVCTTNVDPEEWKPSEEARGAVRERLGLAPETAIILYAGRICRQKQPRVFASTMQRLAERAGSEGTEFVALVAGDGEDRPWLEGFVTARGLEGKVRLLGDVPADEMHELMAASDVFFLPSRWEGVALVAYEAMASGAVFVGADVGGQKELITPDCGILLPKADPPTEVDAYAEALLGLLRDPARRRAMAQAAREKIVGGYRLDDMGERMVELIHRARELHRTEPRPTLDTHLAHELADRAVEHMRLQRVTEHLWRENVELREREHERQNERRRALRPMNAAATGQGSPRGGGQANPKRQAARAQLALIENSRAWRLLEKTKRLPPYPTVARRRFGPDWEQKLRRSPPEQRLQLIRASKGYRLIHGVKSTRAYRWYAIRRYGPEVEKVLPGRGVNGRR